LPIPGRLTAAPNTEPDYVRQSFIAQDGNGRLAGARTAQTSPYDHSLSTQLNRYAGLSAAGYVLMPNAADQKTVAAAQQIIKFYNAHRYG